jgi:hypothetical protein
MKVALSLPALLGAAQPVTIPVSDKNCGAEYRGVMQNSVEETKQWDLVPLRVSRAVWMTKGMCKNGQAICGRRVLVKFAINGRPKLRRSPHVFTNRIYRSQP